MSSDNGQPKKIFISHATADKEYVSLIVSFLQETLWIPASSIFCSSLPGYGVPIAEDFDDCIKRQFRDFELYVLFINSVEFNKSEACVSEIADTLKTNSKYTCLILPGFGYDIIKDALNPQKIAIRFSDSDQEMKRYRLKELAKSIGTWLGTNIADEITLNRAADRLIDNIMMHESTPRGDDYTKLDLLSILVRIKQPFSIDELALSTGYSRSTIRRKLEGYIDESVLSKTRSGRKVNYRVNFEDINEQNLDPEKAYFFGFFENTVRGDAVYGYNGKLLREGKWNGKQNIIDGTPSRESLDLISGIEYDWVIKRESGSMTWNEEEQDYDSDDLEYSKWIPFGDADYQFNWMETQLEAEGLSDYYVADIKVEDGMEQLSHTRTLEKYMAEHYPKKLAQLKEFGPEW